MYLKVSDCNLSYEVKFKSFVYTKSGGCVLEIGKQCNPLFEPRSEKTGLRGFGPGPTQTGLYSHG